MLSTIQKKIKLKYNTQDIQSLWSIINIHKHALMFQHL